jgi:hypothetical protein
MAPSRLLRKIATGESVVALDERMRLTRRSAGSTNGTTLRFHRTRLYGGRSSSGKAATFVTTFRGPADGRLLASIG